MTPVEGEGRQASEMRALAYNYEAARARDTDGIFVLQFLMFFLYFGNKSCSWSTISVWEKKNSKSGLRESVPLLWNYGKVSLRLCLLGYFFHLSRGHLCSLNLEINFALTFLSSSGICYCWQCLLPPGCTLSLVLWSKCCLWRTLALCGWDKYISSSTGFYVPSVSRF